MVISKRKEHVFVEEKLFAQSLVLFRLLLALNLPHGLIVVRLVIADKLLKLAMV